MTEWMPTSDDLLLARLGEVLAPTFDGPSPEAIHAFRQAVTAQRPGTGRPWSLWRRTRLAIVALVGTTTLGAGVAWAAGMPLPSPLRSLASGIGLPVDSPAVSAARNADNALSNQLNAVAHGQGSTAAVAKDAANLSKHLATLSPPELKQLGTTPSSLLTQAHQVVPPSPGTAPAGATGSTTTATAPGSTSTSSPSTTVPRLTLPTLPTIKLPTISLPTLPKLGVTLPSLPISIPVTIPGLLDK